MTISNEIFSFDKDNGILQFGVITSGDLLSVDISADGKYIVAGSGDDFVYTFKNSLVDRPSLIPYGPRNGAEVDHSKMVCR